MIALYRNHHLLPSLLLACLACLTVACDGEPPPPEKTAAVVVPNVYLEAMQEAEAVKHTVEQRNIEQQRIDALIGRGQAQPPSR
jgi:hypothetical protein